MNTARIVVLTIAIGAGGIAAILASGPISPFAAPIAQLQTSQPQTSQQQTWPAITANNNFIDPRGEGLRAVAYGVASPQAMLT